MQLRRRRTGLWFDGWWGLTAEPAADIVERGIEERNGKEKKRLDILKERK
jgi:hypothetical protein